MPSAVHRRLTLAAGLLVLLGLVLVPAGSASAHEDLLRSTPAAGEQLDVAPTEVELEFTDEVLTVGAIVIVADANGDDWVAAEPILERSIVRVPLLDGMPDAGYEIRWRVVSADGHPISGLIPFTVGDAEPFSTGASDEGTGEGADNSDSETNQGDVDAGLIRIALIGAVGAALAVALFVVIEIIARRRRAATGTPDDGDPTTT